MADLPNDSAPSITADALKNAIDGLSAGFRERMDIEAASLLRVASSHVDALLVRAYQDGVRDGFLQGARAQAETPIPWGVKCARCRERQALAREIDGQPVCGHCFYDWLQERR